MIKKNYGEGFLTDMTHQMLESPIPVAPSQKAHFDNISGIKCGTVYLLF